MAPAIPNTMPASIAVSMTGSMTSIAPNRPTNTGISTSASPMPASMPANMAADICQEGSTMTVASHAPAMPTTVGQDISRKKVNAPFQLMLLPARPIPGLFTSWSVSDGLVTGGLPLDSHSAHQGIADPFAGRLTVLEHQQAGEDGRGAEHDFGLQGLAVQQVPQHQRQHRLISVIKATRVAST